MKINSMHCECECAVQVHSIWVCEAPDNKMLCTQQTGCYIEVNEFTSNSLSSLNESKCHVVIIENRFQKHFVCHSEPLPTHTHNPIDPFHSYALQSPSLTCKRIAKSFLVLYCHFAPLLFLFLPSFVMMNTIIHTTFMQLQHNFHIAQHIIICAPSDLLDRMCLVVYK